MPVSGRPEPVALLDTVKALVAALVAAGWITLPEARVFVIGSGLVITVALTLYTRGKVTPASDPVGPAGDPLTPDDTGWDGELDVDDTDLPAPDPAPAPAPPAEPAPEPTPAPQSRPSTSPPARLLGPIRASSTPSGWNGYPVPQVPPSAPRPTAPPTGRRGRHAAADPNDAIGPQDWVGP